VSAGLHTRRAERVWIGAAAVGVIVGIVLFVTGVTPWVAPLAVLVSMTLAIGQRTSWPFAIAAATITEFALIALVLRFTPATGVSLVGGAGIMFAVLGALSIGVLIRTGAHRLIGRRALRVVLPLLIVPVLLVAAVSAWGLFSGNLEWAMRGDAVWNLVTTRVLIADGGLDAVAHPNPSPLAAGLLAIAAAVGRDSVAAADLLRHDAGRFATFWLLATALAGLLAALIGARSVHGGSRLARVGAAAVAGVIPWVWFTFGFSAQFGFYNATLAFVLLLASWLAWLETRVAPIAGAAALSLASVALLATWAPVAALPFLLAVFALVSRLPSLRRERVDRRRVGLLVLTVVPVPLYLLFVTLPDLLREGEALAVDGGIMPIAPVHIAVIVIVTLVASGFTAVHLGQRHQLVGVAIIVGSSALVGAYLAWQRVRADAEWWGYYPAKFSWLVASLLLVVLTATILSELAGARRRAGLTIGVFAAAVGLPWVLMAQVLPTTDRLTSLLTPVAIVTGTGVAESPPAAQRLFDLAVPGERTMVVSYLSVPQDVFLNSWLLQLDVESGSDPIRVYAYGLDPRNEEQACEAVRVWDTPVRIVTSDATLPERFAQLCPDADVVVEVRAQ